MRHHPEPLTAPSKEIEPLVPRDATLNPFLGGKSPAIPFWVVRARLKDKDDVLRLDIAAKRITPSHIPPSVLLRIGHFAEYERLGHWPTHHTAIDVCRRMDLRAYAFLTKTLKWNPGCLYWLELCMIDADGYGMFMHIIHLHKEELRAMSVYTLHEVFMAVAAYGYPVHFNTLYMLIHPHVPNHLLETLLVHARRESGTGTMSIYLDMARNHPNFICPKSEIANYPV